MIRHFTDIGPSQALSFMTQQAAHIETELYRKAYPQHRYGALVPLDRSAPDWTKMVVFQSIDASGKLQMLGPNSTEVPTVDIAMSQGFHEVKTAALGYTYSLEEIGFAMLNNVNLDAEKAMAVRDVSEEGLNRIYLLGEYGVGEGLYTSQVVPVAAAAGTLMAMIAAIPTMGAQPIVTFFNAQVNTIYIDNTRTVRKPNTIVLPPTQASLLRSTMLSDHNGQTLMSFLQENMPGIVFEEDILLEKAGAGGTDRMVVYERDVRVVKGHDVMPLRFLQPATTDNINFKVNALLRTGGTEWRIPKAGLYVDGI